MIPDANYYHNLPKKRMAAGVLFVDDKNNIFLLKPTYKDYWDIPGGVTSENESPRETATRELKKELGLEVKKLKLLCIDYVSAFGPKDESLQFIFFGGKLNEETLSKIKLSEEHSEYKFVSIKEAKILTSNQKIRNFLPRRLEQSLRISKITATIYLENSETVD